uniref:CUB domain-containing protein n=1 Tax=Anolis carolinensis TaxID=28377 RepID=A0A803T317_ANOCA
MQFDKIKYSNWWKRLKWGSQAQANTSLNILNFISVCGGVQQGESGIISSPNYPQPYNSSSLCSWLLIAPEGQTINLTFVAFEIESHRVCGWDSVTILNGGSPSSPVIGQYCGTASPGTIQSGSNQLLINFHSDHSIQGGGFQATWTADSLGCGGILHSENGAIRSPHWPQNFPRNTRCSWTIITHESKHLEIAFNASFQIPDSNGQYYVAIYDGPDIASPLLGKFCGDVSPPAIKSSSNNLLLLFITDSFGAAGGWRASFRETLGKHDNQVYMFAKKTTYLHTRSLHLSTRQGFLCKFFSVET